jgi:hypothetical protein
MSSTVLHSTVILQTAHHFASLANNSMARKLSSIPISIQISPQEVAEQNLTWKNLELATKALHRDGLVVLKNDINNAKLDFLNDMMVEDSLVLQAAGDASPYNYNKG